MRTRRIVTGRIRKLLTTNSREYLDSNNISMALLRTAADLEHLLFCKLFFEGKMNIKQLEKQTLGKFIGWNIEMGLIGKEWHKTLTDFLKLRNLAIHRRVFLDNVCKDEKSLNAVKDTVLSICDLIDSTEVNYESSPELENEYGKFIGKDVDFIINYVK